MERKNMDVGRVRHIADEMRRLADKDIDIALTLGSGLGGFGRDESTVIETSFANIGLPECRAMGHAGIARFVIMSGLMVAILDGRVHLYEGYDCGEVVLAVRAAKLAGAKTQIITCASGGVKPALNPGTIVVIHDHLNLMGRSPLTGLNQEQMGPRFPDMTRPYDPELIRLARRVARKKGLQLPGVVHAALPGPTYETPAEVRMLRILGADTVGMSTVPEVVALRHLGTRVLALSLVTNHAAGIKKKPLSHEEVVATGSAATPVFGRLLRDIIAEIAATAT